MIPAPPRETPPCSADVLAVLTLVGLAHALGVTVSGARRLVLRESIPHAKVGRKIVVRACDFDAWLASRLVRTAPRPAPMPPPTPPEWARDLLRRGSRSGMTAADARASQASRKGAR